MLYEHQKSGVKFLASRSSAMLADEMGLGKSRTALIAAQQLFEAKKIDRVLVLAPAAVRYAWREEIAKLLDDYHTAVFQLVEYSAKDRAFYCVAGIERGLPVSLVSYSLLPKESHLEALQAWCEAGDALLVCDESSFLKNRAAKQQHGARLIASKCLYVWLLTGTPIANSPLDLYGQGLVMGGGALNGFKNWYQFRYRYGVLGGFKGKQIVGYQNVEELTKRFEPFVLRRTKRECLDLPEKTYTVREIALSAETWRVYQELKRDALLSLRGEESRPEPNAVVRLMRLRQITSGYVGGMLNGEILNGADDQTVQDISDEKLSWLVYEIVDGEFASIDALIVWCCWRRERERLQQLAGKVTLYRVFGGQQERARSAELCGFQGSTGRRVLVAQPKAGGFGLNLTAASTAIYLSNDFSYTTRIQSEDRMHRIGQHNACTYVDVLAVGPKSQRTVDSYVLECLREKKNLAELTCAQWRRALDE